MPARQTDSYRPGGTEAAPSAAAGRDGLFSDACEAGDGGDGDGGTRDLRTESGDLIHR